MCSMKGLVHVTACKMQSAVSWVTSATVPQCLGGGGGHSWQRVVAVDPAVGLGVQTLPEPVCSDVSAPVPPALHWKLPDTRAPDIPFWETHHRYRTNTQRVAVNGAPAWGAK